MQDITAPDLKNDVRLVKRAAYIAIFVALSAVGAMIKIPSPVGTIGLDSAPGYFCALAFGYVEGAAVIFIGHLLTAGVVGFPLGLPLHLFIGLQMALWAILVRFIKQKLGLWPAVLTGVVFNGVVSAFTMVFIGGVGAALGIMPFLIAGSLFNILVAAIAYKSLKKGKLI
ncbi:ECF transporter S component [Desulfosediminicola ganghwensis]|uniref:ECF transporter S component n=1 Tax=Desulfosediminicola ganghwensis TaxID=2569540 RepID=UPI0010AC9C7F|nr:ECF transporter S component [Desulfosediminicola ganghwensis]